MLPSPADPGVAPSTDTAVSLEPTTAGTDLTTEHSGGRAVDARLNGETIATLDGGGTGSTVFLPSRNGSDGRFVDGPA